MAVVSGGVNVTVAVNGVGNAPKVVADTKKEVEGLGQKIGTTMKGAVGPLNQVKEGFERVRGNALFVAGAVALLVGGFEALYDQFSANGKAIAAWKEQHKTLQADLMKTGELIEAINVKLGRTPPKSELEKLGDQANKTWKANEEAIKKADAALLALRDDYETMQGSIVDNEKTQQAFLTAIGKLETERLSLLTAQAGLIDANTAKIAAQGVAAAALNRALGGKGTDEGWHINFAGEIESKSMEDARKQRLYAAIAANPRAVGGARSRYSDAAPYPADRPINMGNWASADLGGGARDTDKTANALRAQSDTFNQVSEWGGYIRDFTSALSDSLPGMDAFASALSGISSMWAEYAQGNTSAAKATIFSVGAIAKAGAEQIKNERLRAGVLSIIELGLGSASIAVYDYPAAAAHFTAAAVLGSVAIFGGGGGGGGSRDKNRAPTRSSSLSERTTSGAVNFIINGTYIAGHSGQETAAELSRLMRSGGGGFVPSGAA